MDLIDRYLAAVGRHLPDKGRADIIAELRDVLLSRVEDEEGRLERAMTREEVEGLLTGFGHPLSVAGRYRKVQHLIGPEVFPFWWAGLKAALTIVGGIYLMLVLLVILSSGDARAMARATPSFETAMIVTFGVVTLVCALIERFGKATMLLRWKPRELPPVRAPKHARFELAVEAGMYVVFILWWLGVVRFGNLIPRIGLSWELAPIWKVWFWPILVYSIFDLAVRLIALLRPGWVRGVEMLMLVSNLVGAAILGAVYQAGHWIAVKSTSFPPEVLDAAQRNFDAGMRIGIGVTIVVFTVKAAISAWRLWRMKADEVVRP